MLTQTSSVLIGGVEGGRLGDLSLAHSHDHRGLLRAAISCRKWAGTGTHTLTTMDELGVAVAAVIVAGLTGLGGVGTALWTTKRNERLTLASISANAKLTRETLAANERLSRENRVEDKRADAYLELLRLLEREGLALESTMVRLDASTEPDYGQAKPRTIERPPLSDRAAINALLAALRVSGTDPSRRGLDRISQAVRRGV